MSRFNQKRKTSNQDHRVNYEGEPAHGLAADMALYSAVCSFALQPKFYVPDTEEQLEKIRLLVKSNSPEFVAKLAIYAREEMYLRTIPLVLLVELAKIHRSRLIRDLAFNVIQRADELCETLSYYQIANERTGERDKLKRLGSQLKKGIADAFHKFDEYQFAKYNRPGEINLKRALRLTHPRPLDDDESALFKKILDDELETPYTWETELTKAGETGRSKKEVWEELIDSRKVGYMATLRNLRNIIKAEISISHIEKICDYISNPEAVKRSKQLPFRFYSAYKELKNFGSFYSKPIFEALEKAIQISIENIPINREDKVLIACDVSGSMDLPIARNSSVHRFDIGIILGMLLNIKCKYSISGMFGDIWKVIQMPSDNVLKNADEFHRRVGEVGCSTNGYKVIEWLLKKEEAVDVDKVMIFTDCQLWHSGGPFEYSGKTYYPSGYPAKRMSTMESLWNEYIRRNPKSKLYLFDLAGYGNVPISVKRPDVFLISGWSDRVFDMLDALNKGSSVIDEIRKIEIKKFDPMEKK